MTHFDHIPVLAQEAEIIHACSYRGLAPTTADSMELWEIASYLGLHRIETVEDRDQREIVETKGEYWEETQRERMGKLAGYSERKKARAKARREQRKAS